MRFLWLALLLAPLCRAEDAPLRVMTDLWPPFRMESESGELQGLDIDLLAELSRRTALRYQPVAARQ